jgi:hypothetical protein
MQRSGSTKKRKVNRVLGEHGWLGRGKAEKESSGEWTGIGIMDRKVEHILRWEAKKIGDRIQGKWKRENVRRRAAGPPFCIFGIFPTWLIPLHGRWTKRVHTNRQDAYNELRDVTNQTAINFVVITTGKWELVCCHRLELS